MNRFCLGLPGWNDDFDEAIVMARGLDATFYAAATGVTDGGLLRGVRYSGGGAHTQSIVMRSKSGTVRVIEAYQRLDKLREYATIYFTGDANAAAPMP